MRSRALTTTWSRVGTGNSGFIRRHSDRSGGPIMRGQSWQEVSSDRVDKLGKDNADGGDARLACVCDPPYLDAARPPLMNAAHPPLMNAARKIPIMSDSG